MNRISIALCTYNGATYLDEQLDSILKQTLQPLELCVGDDGSTDATLDILDRFAATAPFPVTVKRNPVNLGYGENFIQTAKRCTGQWIAFCDQDDLWLPTKLERCAELIDQGPEDLRMVVHNAAIVDTEGKYEGVLMKGVGYDWNRLTIFAKNQLPPAWMMYGNCMVFDQNLIRDVPTDKRAWPCFTDEPHESHDSWIPILAAALGSVAATSDRLVNYRRHGSNVTTFLVPPGAKQRLMSKFFPDPEYFAFRAHQLSSLSDRLVDRIDYVTREDYKNDLVVLANRYSLLAKAYIHRAEISRGQSIAVRFRAFRTLASLGVYHAPKGWGFRRTGMAKDIIHALLGRPRWLRRA